MRNWNNIIFVGLEKRNVWTRRRSCGFRVILAQQKPQIERNVFKHLIVMQSVDWRIELLFFVVLLEIEKNEKKNANESRKENSRIFVRVFRKENKVEEKKRVVRFSLFVSFWIILTLEKFLCVALDSVFNSG